MRPYSTLNRVTVATVAEICYHVRMIWHGNIKRYPYFAYGSNLSKSDMTRRCPDAVADTTAVLPDYRLTFRGVADIEPAPGHKVIGAIWLVSRKDISRLDTYEGTPYMYIRRNVIVETPDGPRPALTYVMVENRYNGTLALPSPGYAGIIADGYSDWGLDPDALMDAIDFVSDEHEEIGVVSYMPSGSKRMLAVLDDEPYEWWEHIDGMTPATKRLYELEDDFIMRQAA